MWSDGQVIVKLSFSEDHDKTFLAATSAFVKTGLIPRAKNYLSRATADAIDLLVTRSILRDGRRAALRLFNDALVGIANECKERYYAMEDIDAQRMFRPVLLQQYYYLGEYLGDASPKDKHSAEADEFLWWLHKLATREPDEQSELAFAGSQIRVGVILIASDETYRNYGLDPYLRRAEQYAALQFDTIYLISRGRRRASITKDIGAALVGTGYFTSVGKVHDLDIPINNVVDVVTILPLRADLVGIVQNGWRQFKEHQQRSERVTVTIDSVNIDSIVISGFGLKASIRLSDLSDLEITDARRYFRKSQQIEVNVLEVDHEREILHLSNRSTNTDPKKLVDEASALIKDGAYATVKGFRTVEGVEMGIVIAFENTAAEGYIPRQRASFSRFVPLSETYQIGRRIPVAVNEFQPRYNNFLAEVVNRIDPWESVSKYGLGRVHEGVLRQISERYILYELEPGIEAVVFVEEIAWATIGDNMAAIRHKKVGEHAPVYVMAVNREYRLIRGSLKRAHQHPAEMFCAANADAILPVEVKSMDATGASVTGFGADVDGIIPRREVSWIYCPEPRDRIKEGQRIDVRLLRYDDRRNAAIFSVREVFPNSFETCQAVMTVGAGVKGTVLGHIGSNAELAIEWRPGLFAAAYVHKSEITNVAYLEDEDVRVYLPVGTVWPFLVKRIDEPHRVLELSRKQVFRQTLHSLRYGVIYSTTLTRLSRGECCLYGETVESSNVQLLREHSVGDTVNVHIARRGEKTTRARSRGNIVIADPAD